MTTYSYRTYSCGDEADINALYELITGRHRTKEQWAWQWLDAPGGTGEIWLIEADEGSGKKIIGHHGVMPIRFTFGEDDLLFGKTENTFVHPDYREKILYPRFEGRFRSHYEGRFSALFSTTGPGAAIRQRQAQGYESSRKWVTYLWAVDYGRSLRLFGEYVLRRRGAGKFTNRIAVKEPPHGPEGATHNGVRITAHEGSGAGQSNFFDSFWGSIRKKYPVTPSRGLADLKWRYWNNPYQAHTTLVLDSETAGAGVAILHKGSDGRIIIDDFYVEMPGADTYNYLLNAVLHWASLSRAACVQFTTTDDSLEWLGSSGRRICRYWDFQPYLNKIRKTPASHMPRKICDSGVEASLKDRLWYVTDAVSQGVD